MKTLYVTIVVAGALACAPGALAAPAPPMTVEVHPASGEVKNYFDFEARPGRTAVAGTLVLRNRLERSVTVLLDPVDGLTASTLGSAYRVRGAASHGSTNWIALSDRRVELAPRGKAELAVTVQPPQSAKPGDYLSGIGVQALGVGKEAKPRGNVAIASIQRYAVGVLIRLPGPRHPLIRFTGARVAREAAGVTFYISARNLGNDLLQDVRGSQLITQGNRVVARGPIGPGTFVTGTSIDYPVLVPRERAREGTEYRVRANLHYRGRVARLDTLVRFGHGSAVRQEQLGGPEASSSGDGILKYLLAGAAGLVLLSLLAFLLWRRRRKRPREPAEPPEDITSPDDRAREKVPVG
jgi:MYXO-CTERM domain-containing protein